MSETWVDLLGFPQNSRDSQAMLILLALIHQILLISLDWCGYWLSSAVVGSVVVVLFFGSLGRASTQLPNK